MGETSVEESELNVYYVRSLLFLTGFQTTNFLLKQVVSEKILLTSGIVVGKPINSSFLYIYIYIFIYIS